MTLILALGNSDQFVQLSDRRLSWNGSLIDDESSKAGYLICPNARLAFGSTGLARLDSFRTREWLLETLQECGPPDYDARGVLQRLGVRAIETFRFHPVLRSSPRQHRRLSIIFSGYLHHGRSPLAGYAILSNFQDFESGLDAPEAWDQFSVTFGSEERPPPYEPTLVLRIGNWHAMTRDDEESLRTLLQARKPATAIIGKAVELIHQVADRPAANGTIGKQLSVLCIPRDPKQRMESYYYTSRNTLIAYGYDGVILFPRDNWAIKDFEIRITKSDGAPGVAAVPKVGRNQPCPCHSGKKFKHCHGRSIPTLLIPPPGMTQGHRDKK